MLLFVDIVLHESKDCYIDTVSSVYTEFNLNGFIMYIRKRPDIVDINVFINPYRDFSRNSVPVSLGILRGHMSSLGGVIGVVNHYCYSIFPGSQRFSYIVYVRSVKAVEDFSDPPTVYPEHCFSCSFKKKLRIFKVFFFYIEAFSIPGISLKPIFICKKARLPFFIWRSLF